MLGDLDFTPIINRIEVPTKFGHPEPSKYRKKATFDMVGVILKKIETWQKRTMCSTYFTYFLIL